jgi:hypothetical protein
LTLDFGLKMILHVMNVGSLLGCFISWKKQTLNQCCGSGSGIRCFFTPGIRDGAIVGSGSGISKQNLLIAFIQK